MTLPSLSPCPWFFRSHGCDLAEGHPPELGHICLVEDYDAIPDQGGYCNRLYAATYSYICYRVESDDPDLFT